MPAIRILQMIGGLNIGGSQKMLLNLYENIDRDRVRFDFILDHADYLHYADTVQKLGGRIFFVPRFRGVNLPAVRQAWTDLFRTHPGYRVLHTHVRSYASVFLPIASKAGLITIAHSHNTANPGGLTAPLKACLQYPIRYQADYRFACSDAAGKWLFGKKACQGERFAVIPNAISPKSYTYDAAVRERVRRSLGISDRFVIGNVGRLCAAKNQLFLPDVLAKVRHHRPDAVLLLAGEGELRQAILQKSAALGLSDSVILTGARDDIPKLMQAMDVFAFPSRFEGLPLTLIEAQASGLPCLIPDNVTDEITVTPLCRRIGAKASPADWANALLTMHAVPDREIYAALVERTRFSVAQTARRMEDFYCALANTNDRNHLPPAPTF